MGNWTRAEVEDAYADYRSASDRAGASGDWSPWADLFTEDAIYIEHHLGTFHGREAIRRWIVETMAAAGRNMPDFPVDWSVVDHDRGWVVFCAQNRMADPGDGSVHEAASWSLIKYAGDGQWCYEEDMYNPNEFDTMMRGWAARRRDLSAS